MTGIPLKLKSAKGFHSHLGPYLVVGLKMGEALTKELGDTPFSFSIVSYTGSEPPISCIIDGLQLSTPCTVGNGGILIRPEGRAKVEGRMDKRRILLSLREKITWEIKTNCIPENEEELALRIWKMTPEELFDYEAY